MNVVYYNSKIKRMEVCHQSCGEHLFLYVILKITVMIKKTKFSNTFTTLFYSHLAVKYWVIQKIVCVYDSTLNDEQSVKLLSLSPSAWRVKVILALCIVGEKKK